MTDRELLEAAAKAAGYRIEIEENWTAGELPYIHLLDENRRCWFPLRDDGDALRLAVKLHITVSNSENQNHACASSIKTPGISLNRHNGDPYAATRRAIVRAAAEIGKAMK